MDLKKQAILTNQIMDLKKSGYINKPNYGSIKTTHIWNLQKQLQF